MSPETDKPKTRNNRAVLARGWVFLLLLILYPVAYACNSALGGYWLKPEREAGSSGDSVDSAAVLWQPRVGHRATGATDGWGTFFAPMIAIDRKWFHPSKPLGDPAFDHWLDHELKASRVHPEFQEFFREYRARIASQ